MNSNNNTSQSLWKFAYKFVNTTDRSIFLTGKAGTGKTTFLKTIINETHKKTVIAAPTGIAAINAGGVTLHSLFHLPFGCFVPDNFPKVNGKYSTGMNTPSSLIYSHRMNENKRKLIKEMELLIIDEVSMLRADALDAIDTVLRHIRKKNITFGGVQILFIGDLFQLPPVIKQEEQEILAPYYTSGYFFEAKALQKQQPVYIELDKVYRQSDKKFINILNRVRENNISTNETNFLNKFYNPSIEPSAKEGYIFLTTHNKKADNINQKALNNLKEKSFYFDAEIEGNFGEHLYPIPYRQEFKKGAQVMFIKNDYSGEQKYFNGKIGTISNISKEEIRVSFPDDSPDTLVEKYTWENKKFKLDSKTKEIKENIQGTFRHFPLKLAWAVTIHKSQGLTFEKAVIDAGDAFAPGQIYVALSRLVSLDGLVLKSPIPEKNLSPPPALQNFINNKKEPKELEDIYRQSFTKSIENSAVQSFDFQQITNICNDHVLTYTKDEKKSVKQKYKDWAADLRDMIFELAKTGDKFQKQIVSLCRDTENSSIKKLNERIKAAKNYFEPELEELFRKVMLHKSTMEKQKGTKKYVKELEHLASDIYKKIEDMYITDAFLSASIARKDIPEEVTKVKSLLNEKRQQIIREYTGNNGEQKKNTREISFEMFQEGKTVEEIAELRSLAVSTIENHLSCFVKNGKIDVTQFIDEIKNKQIKKVAEALETLHMKEIKSKLGDEFTYSDIRFALADLQKNSDGK